MNLFDDEEDQFEQQTPREDIDQSIPEDERYGFIGMVNRMNRKPGIKTISSMEDIFQSIERSAERESKDEY